MAESYANESTGNGGVVQATPEGGGQRPQLRVTPTAGTVGEAGLSAAASSASRGLDPSVMGLLDIASDMLQPAIKQAKQEQFMRGVQEAQSGKALTEIMAEQPAYANVFSPSAAAEGARAYTVQAQLAGFAADMESRMPLLAQQDPTVVRQEVFDRMQESMTGDAAADAVITQAAVEQFGPLFKRHAKAHYEHLQYKASEAQMNAWLKGASAYNSQVSDPKISPEDRAAADARMLGQMGPFSGQPDLAYMKQATTFLDTTLAEGNFAVLRLFQNVKDADGNSVWDSMDAGARDAITRKLPGYAQKALEKHLPNYAVELNMITKDVEQNPALLPARIAEFNAKVAKETGIVEFPAVPLGQVDNIVGSVMVSQRNEAQQLAQREATAAAKAAEEAQKVALASEALNHPNAASQQLELGFYENKHLSLAAWNKWNAETDPAKRAGILMNRPEGTFSSIRGYLTEAGIGRNPEKMNAGVQHVADIFKNLPPNLQGTYFSAEDIKFYDAFNEQLSRDVPAEQAFLVAKTSVPRAKLDIPEDERTVMQAAIREVMEDRNEGFFGGNNLDDASYLALENMGMEFMTKYNVPGQSPEVAANRALSAMMDAQGVQTIGQSVIMSFGKKYESFTKMVGTGAGNVGPAEAGKRFDKLLDARLKERDGSRDNYRVTRVDAENVMVVFQNSEYRDRHFFINVNDLRTK